MSGESDNENKKNLKGRFNYSEKKRPKYNKKWCKAGLKFVVCFFKQH